MWKLTAVLAVVSSLGVLGHQGLIVHSAPRAADLTDMVQIDELRELGAAMAPDAFEIKAPVKPVIVHESAIPGAVSGFMVTGTGTAVNAKARKATAAPVRMTVPAVKRSAPVAKSATTSLKSPFSNRRSTLSSALSKNFFAKGQFGFSERVKQTSAGKKVRTVERWQ